MAVPVIDYQQLAQSLLANIGAVPGAAPIAGGAHAASTAHYNGDHMDIERIESSMKKFLSDNCVDTNATVLQNIRTFLDHAPNVSRTRLFCMRLAMTWSGSHHRTRSLGDQFLLQHGDSNPEGVQ